MSPIKGKSKPTEQRFSKHSNSISRTFNEKMLRQLVLDAQIQEKFGQRISFAKKRRQAKERQKNKMKQKPKRQHSYSAAFSTSVQSSRSYIEQQSTGNVENAYQVLHKTLSESTRKLSSMASLNSKARQHLSSPLNEDDIEWNSADGQMSGSSKIGANWSSLIRLIESGEEHLSDAKNVWDRAEAALHVVLKEAFGSENYETLILGSSLPLGCASHDHETLLRELEHEKKKAMETIKELDRSTMIALKDNEEIFRARERQINEMKLNFGAMFGDEDD